MEQESKPPRSGSLVPELFNSKNMKLSWSVVVITSFGLFICFMGYFVVKINTDPALKHHLVTPQYYKEELKENDKNRARNNASTWARNLDHRISERGLILFPLPKKQLFTIQGYRPSDPKKDFFVHGKSLIGAEQLTLELPSLEKGIWKLIITWEKEGKPYRIEYEFKK